jgi:nucleoside-diphosphate-sugar epimerase
MAGFAKIYFTTKSNCAMKIFITGATGYIGNNLALKLADSNNIVHALVRNPDQAKSLAHPNIKLFKGSINDIDSIRNAIDGCGQVFHLASFVRLWARPSDIFFKVNVEGTSNVLAAAVEKNVAGLVYTSSTAVLGISLNEPLSENDPRIIGFNNDYDLSKCMAEKLVMDYAAKGLHALIVNPSRVYGPGIETYSNPFTRFLKASIKGKMVAIPKCPDVIANYSYVRDVVNGHILAMKYGQPGERYILGGENISYKEMLSVVKELLPEGRPIAVPKMLLKAAGGMQLLKFYFTKKQPAFTPSAISRYYSNTAFNCGKAIKELNYKITPFKKGITETILHLKKIYGSK